MHFEELIYPPYNAPLMEAYGGEFESVYVILHPFVSVPSRLAWKVTKAYPSDEQIVRDGAECTWASVASETSLPTCSKLNQALLTSIGAIGEELCDYPASRVLQSLLQTQSVWMPAEGRFEPLLQMDFLDIFSAGNRKELIFIPEFPGADPIQQLNIERLRSREIAFPNRGTLAAPDQSFLITVDWDSFFTLFFGPHAFLADMAHRHNLEGFFATPATEHFWFNYSLGCSVVTVAPNGWAAA
ncbi:MAG: DUF2711 family protein [Terracidiphilus sp.]